jgi:acetyl-CoA carboxylase biotin carboxyl carrier protein
MDLTNEDVTDILALLDSLPYDELDLQTPRFRLTLRRTPDGWTQSTDTRVAPTVVDVIPAGGAGAATAAAGAATAAAGAATPAAGAASAAAGAASAAAGVATAATEATEAAGVAMEATEAAPMAAAAAAATGPMFHRAGDNRPDVPSGRLGSEADSAGGTKGVTGVSLGATGPGVGAQDAGHGATEVDVSLVAVRAPLPGTFYRAPRPAAAPFVEVGSRVGADTVVGIVETMKLFNSVTAGAAGTVAEICLGNAEFADRGTTLLRIRVD